MGTVIKSIGYNQQEIINNIINLYCPTGIDADVCYSKGVFYKNGVVKEPKLKFDVIPQTEDTIKSDCRELPLDSESINCIMFDPPFLATKGKSLIESKDNNLINKRFGVYPTEDALWEFYCASLREFKRVLKENGILIFKCQDKVSSGKQIIIHNKIINEAEKLGFYCEDLFVLLAKSRLVADWQLRNQKHSRKFHSYFLIFRKLKNKKNIMEVQNG